MKKLLIPVLALLPAFVSAHGQHPTTISETVYQPITSVSIELHNLYSDSVCYEFEHNGQLLDRKVCLKPASFQTESFYIQHLEDKPTDNKICSIALIKGSFQTKVCTQIKTLYPASILKELGQ